MSAHTYIHASKFRSISDILRSETIVAPIAARTTSFSSGAFRSLLGSREHKSALSYITTTKLQLTLIYIYMYTYTCTCSYIHTYMYCIHILAYYTDAYIMLFLRDLRICQTLMIICAWLPSWPEKYMYSQMFLPAFKASIRAASQTAKLEHYSTHRDVSQMQKACHIEAQQPNHNPTSITAQRAKPPQPRQRQHPVNFQEAMQSFGSSHGDKHLLDACRVTYICTSAHLTLIDVCLAIKSIARPHSSSLCEEAWQAAASKASRDAEIQADL
jgi:hypothetical protein